MQGDKKENITEQEVKEEVTADMVDINDEYEQNECNGERIQYMKT